ncbi:VWA domain-containing protein, partial [Streptomyces sp. NPDC054804]
MITSAPSALRVRASATALFLTAAMLLGASAPRADDLPAAPSPDDICRSLHVDDVPASYVVLVDTSSSMEDRGPDGATQYDTVRKRLRSFLAGLGPSDQVALVSFGRSVGVVHPLGPAAGGGGGGGPPPRPPRAAPPPPPPPPPPTPRPPPPPPHP